MSRDDVIEKLRELELKAAGVVHLRLHGSYARQTQVEASSDIDLIAEFDPKRRYTLIDMVRTR
jgi:predicted nucleotidyltransferase